MLKAKKRDGWFRRRGYLHLDRPLSFDAACALVKCPKKVAARGFLPFLGFADEKRQFRTDNSDRTIPKRLRPRFHKVKSRDIRYASHADGAIFAYYAFQLQEAYEEYLKANSLGEVVIGYRPGLGSNVDMAAAAFAEVASRGSCVALAFDISDFFPSIEHDTLKRSMVAVLGGQELSSDWYKVFRAMTKSAWIDLNDLYAAEGFNRKTAPSPLVSDIPAALKRYRLAGMIHTNIDPVGIPQGSPISAVMANVAMIEFDIAVSEWATGAGAYYRRYSDDILIIADLQRETEATKLIQKVALGTGRGLVINSDKTEISRFTETPSPGVHLCDQPLTYLGFTYDGRSASLKARTLSRYYRRMTYAARATVRGAAAVKATPAQAFRRSVYRDLTHLGRRNFYQYAKRSDSVFHSSVVKKQLRRHFAIVLRKLRQKGR